MLESLDCPDPSVLAPKRTSTITPVQSLSMFNDSFMEKCAERFAERVRREAGDDVGRQIDLAWRSGRLARCRTITNARSPGRFVMQHDLDQLCLVLFNANEFLFVD